MKTKNLSWLFVSLFLLAVPAVHASAADNEIEIELMEVSGFPPVAISCVSTTAIPTTM